jgi:hypothetical protein
MVLFSAGIHSARQEQRGTPRRESSNHVILIGMAADGADQSTVRNHRHDAKRARR